MEGFIGTTEQQPQNPREDKGTTAPQGKSLCNKEPMEGVEQLLWVPEGRCQG